MRSRTLTIALLAALPLTAALAGLRWGLPGGDRSAKLLPPAWDRAALFDTLASGWQEIYDRSKGSTPVLAENAGKYSTRLDGPLALNPGGPLPRELRNSYRSMIIRSMYPDEALPLSDLAQMKPQRLDLRPPSFLYGGGYVYPLGAYLLTLSRLHIVERLPLRAALDRPEALASIYLAGRFLSALAFAGLCVLCFLITEELAGGSAGLYAWLLACAAPLALAHAHYLTPHLWAAFWSLLALYLLLRPAPGHGLKAAAVTGACFGLSAGSYWSQLHAALFLTAVLWAEERPAADRLRRACVLAAAAALTFILFNPYILSNWRMAIHEMFSGGGIGGTYPGNLYDLIVKVLPAAMGLTPALAAMAGCAWGISSKDRRVKALSLACTAMLLLAPLVIPGDSPSWTRRFFPWTFLALVPAGLALARLAQRLPAAGRAALLAACFIPAAMTALLCESDFLRAATPDSAYAKMGSELDAMPADGTLGLTEFPQPANTPVFRIDRWKLLLAAPVKMAGLAQGDLPEYLLLPYFQKTALPVKFLENYSLVTRHSPAGPVFFRPLTDIVPADIPVELYRLKK